MILHIASKQPNPPDSGIRGLCGGSCLWNGLTGYYAAEKITGRPEPDMCPICQSLYHIWKLSNTDL